MKRIFTLIFASLLLTSVSYAQTEQGRTLISGSTNLSYSTSKSQDEYDGRSVGDKTKLNKINFTPSFGYFLFDNFVAGVSFSFKYDRTKNQEMKFENNSLSAGPFVRYYLGNSKIKPYIHGDMLFGKKIEDFKLDTGDFFYDIETKVENKLFDWDLGGGIAIFLNNTVSIDLGLVYSSSSYTDKDDNKRKTKETGLALNAGFSIFL